MTETSDDYRQCERSGRSPTSGEFVQRVHGRITCSCGASVVINPKRLDWRGAPDMVIAVHNEGDV